MFCKTRAEAARQAKANTERSGKAWIFFTDTSGNHRCECRPDLTGCANVRTSRTDLPSFAGVSVVIVQPDAP